MCKNDTVLTEFLKKRKRSFCSSNEVSSFKKMINRHLFQFLCAVFTLVNFINSVSNVTMVALKERLTTIILQGLSVPVGRALGSGLKSPGSRLFLGNPAINEMLH